MKMLKQKFMKQKKEQERRLLQGDGVGSLQWLEVKQSWWEKKKKGVTKLGMQYTWKMAFNIAKVFQTPWQ
jgi:hypothetical protein